MNIQLAIQHGTNILTDKRINTAKLDAEILMAKTLKKDRKFIILNKMVVFHFLRNNLSLL